MSHYALWWAPDGSSILFGRFDDSPVEDYQFPLYGDSAPSHTQYTTIDTIAYPKVCEVECLLSLFISPGCMYVFVPRTV